MSAGDGQRREPARRLALLAATAGPEDARRAWDELVDRFDLAELWDAEVYRLLPLVWHRLGDDVGAEHVDRLRGTYRKAWVTSQHLLRQGGEAVVALREEGVDSLVVGGLALGLLFYEDLCTRPVLSVDLLVRPEDVVATWRRLADLGYRSRSVRPPVRSRWTRDPDDDWYLRLDHPRTFDRGTLDVIDVHTSLAPELVAVDGPTADESDLWEQSVEVDLGSATARTLSPTHHLFHTVLPAAGADGTGSLGPVVDGVTILASAEAQIDWSGLVATARRHRCSLVVAAGLETLDRQCGVAVPAGIDAALRDPPPDRRQRIAAMLRNRSGADGVGLGPSAATFVTRSRGLGPLATLGRAPGFLADHWQLDRRRHLPLAALHRLRRRLRPS